MSYVLYRVTGPGDARAVRTFETVRAAKISMAAYLRKAALANKDWRFGIMEAQAFQENYNYMVPVTNLMSGLEVWIRNQDKGGPCDPSTERYWSM